MKKMLVILLSLMFVSCSLFVTQVPSVPEETTKKDETASIQAPVIQEELRGAWVTRFAYADSDPDSMKMKIINSIKNVSAGNFNAVFFQLRGQCETFYPSPYEPWSKLLNFKNPGFDPAKLAIEEAHKRGLKFYAYVNLLPMWNEPISPKDSSHLFYQHGPETLDNWTLMAKSEEDQANTSYFYLNPAHPAVKTYLKKVIRHLVKNYDIDGLHFDRIRYPGANYLYDEYSAKTFLQDSLDSSITKEEWARKQLTDLVEDVVVEAMSVKPYLVNSAATWGLYRTDDMAGYEEFGSGYARYYQDAIDWLDRGIVDFITPMIYWDMENPLPNFNDLWLDFKERTANYEWIFPGLRIYDCDWIENGETAKQIDFVRNNGGRGTVMFAIGAENDKRIDMIRDSIYTEKISIPSNLKRLRANQFCQLSFDNDKKVNLIDFFRTKTPDSEGEFGLIMKRKPDTLRAVANGDTLAVSTQFWAIPYNYKILSDSTYTRQKPWVEIRKMPSKITKRNKFPFLFKSDCPAKVYINENSVKQYKTGVFFDMVDLNEGANRIAAKVEYPDKSTAIFCDEYFYKKVPAQRDTFPLWIDEKSFEPAQNLELLPSDDIVVSFKASAGQKAKLIVGDFEQYFVRQDFDDYSHYEALLPGRKLPKNKELKLNIQLSGSKGEQLSYSPRITIIIRDLEDFPIVQTIDKNAVLYYTLGQIRLGGPIRAEYKPGVMMKTSGKFGDNYRIRLSGIEEGFITANEVKILKNRVATPGYFITSMSCRPSKDADVVRIPYRENVPFAVYPEPEQNRIVVALYGVKTTSTWITHLQGRKIIDKVTWQQTSPETYSIYVNLKDAKIWGYDLIRNKRSLELKVKYPPKYNVKTKKPLKGLKIAIEAGHGGSNLGAVGLSGLLEKDINLSLAQMLGDICKTKGAEVFQVRGGDDYMYLGVKRDSSLHSNSDLHISIHANAGGTYNGYLGASGTSTYWHNPFWAPFAEKVYDNLLKMKLIEFGVVGSFNYKVTRMSEMPSILVEQAFLSNAEDEEKLADPKFRREMAQKIYDGIIDYLEYMK